MMKPNLGKAVSAMAKDKAKGMPVNPKTMMAKGGAVKKGMAKGGMAKKGYK